jgi:hypothetical protein
VVWTLVDLEFPRALEGSATLPSLSLLIVTYDISNLLAVPAIKHHVILAGGLG